MPTFWEELFRPTITGANPWEPGPMRVAESPGMLSQMSSPAIPREWQTDLAPTPKGPIEYDYSQGIPMPYRGRAPSASERMDEGLAKFRETNPVPITPPPPMEPSTPIPGLLGDQISAVPPGVGGNPAPAPAGAPPLPPPIEVGGGPKVASLPTPAPGEGPPTDMSAARRPGIGGPVRIAGPSADFMAPAAPPREKNFLQRFDEMTQKNSGLLLALAAGFAGAPSFGTGMSRAFGNAAPFAQVNQSRAEQQAQVNQNANMTARALMQRGAPAEEVAAAVRNPELMKALIGKYFETGKPTEVGGRLVRTRPDGTVEVLFDGTRSKTPKIEEFTTDQGKVKRQWNEETQQWEPVPGFERPVLDEKDKRRLNVTDTLKLQEQGGKLQQVANFSKSFKDPYGGFVSDTLGDAANAAGRRLPASVVGKERAASATWWQQYDRYKNVVRNELFGSALTAPEKAAFEAADIRPGMTPEQIKANLEYQRKITSNGVKRAGMALIEQGYDAGAIAKAYGVKPEFFNQALENFDDPAGGGGTVDVGGKKLNWSVTR